MPEKRQAIVAIDGPAGVGKSTISRLLADHLGFTYLDTGSMYRALAHALSKTGKPPAELAADSALDRLVEGLDMELLPPAAAGEEHGRVRIDGQVLGPELRTERMSRLASDISALPAVRAVLTRLQQRMGSAGRMVAEGRDIGTVVFPQAAWKFFLEASPEERARRRVRQLRARGETVLDEAALLQSLLARDQADRERSIAPLRPAADARLLDTSFMTIHMVLDEMLAHIHAHPL